MNHWQIIEDALEKRKSDWYTMHPDNPVRIAALARLDAALAFVREMRQPLDMPDSAGWWAFEDDRDKFVAHLAIFRCADGEVEFKFDSSSKDTITEDAFRAMYPGKWYRVHLPWDAPQEVDNGS